MSWLDLDCNCLQFESFIFSFCNPSLMECRGNVEHGALPSALCLCLHPVSIKNLFLLTLMDTQGYNTLKVETQVVRVWSRQCHVCLRRSKYTILMLGCYIANYKSLFWSYLGVLWAVLFNILYEECGCVWQRRFTRNVAWIGEIR